MEKKQSRGVLITILVVILVGGGVAFFANQNTATAPEQTGPKPSTEASITAAQDASEEVTITYEGEEGTDALSLLKKDHDVTQDSSGLVSAIDGIEAAAENNEYWAFYVNNEMAPVGPAEYQTKDGDMIEWRIETF